MRRDAHRTGDVLAGREGERLVAEEVADSERIVAHGELGEFTGGPPKAIAIAAAGGTGRRPRRLRRWSRWMQLIARSTAGQLRPSRYQQMVLAEPAQRARLLHAAVAALPPHQLHRSTERRNIMQPPQSPAVPDAISLQLGQPVSARCDCTVNRSPAATVLLRSRQAGPTRARRAC